MRIIAARIGNLIFDWDLLINTNSISGYRHLWLPDLLVIVGLMVALTPLFWFSDLDLVAANLFYDPTDPKNPWPAGENSLWLFFYHGAPLLSALILIGGLGTILASSLKPRFAYLKPYAIFMLLVIITGPGLLVNGVFKDNWGRPRPRQVIELGGDKPYVPPLLKQAKENGKSFPAGHPSVAFSLCALWFVFRRRHRHLAITVTAGAALLGTLFGIGRMAAGGHFLSDVIWSALITISAGWLLYYFVLRIPQREDQPEQFKSLPIWVRVSSYSLVGVAILGGALIATPQKADWQYVAPANGVLSVVSLEARQADLTIEVRPLDGTPFELYGTLRGFGLPTNRIAYGPVEAREANHLAYRITQEGFFTELDTKLTLIVNDKAVDEININLELGDIVVRNPSPLSHRPRLNLHTGQGKLSVPDKWR